MRKKIQHAVLLFTSVSFFHLSCQKEMNQELQQEERQSSKSFMMKDQERPPFDLNVNLYGEGNWQGHLKFRQDPDLAKIIDLDIKVHHLAPNREYLLQRAVDVINVVDGNCTSTSWLTLGYGLNPHAILTDEKGNGEDILWRDVTAIPTGSSFDIHFRVIDAITLNVVLVSDCYQYTVR